MNLEKFIATHGPDCGHGDVCLHQWCDMTHPSTRAAEAELEQLRARLAAAKAIIRILMQAADRAGFGISIPPTPDTAPMLVMLEELGYQSPFTKVEKL